MNLYKQIESEILSARNIVITSHKSPDGDSIGSSLALLHFIEKLGKTAVICHPDPAPDFLTWWLDGIFAVRNLESDKELVEEQFQKADLVFCLDYNAPDRVGEEMQALLLASGAKKVMIDHHLNPAEFTDITVSSPEACSTAQLIFELIDQSGNLEKLDARIGTPVYLGILTDTGSFRFASVKPRTHEILGKLLEAGVQHHLVHENLNDNNTLNRLRLQGYAMCQKLEVLEECQSAVISLTEEELKRFNAQKGDTEGLANMALTIRTVKVAVFLSEKEGKIKMSFRSQGEENAVNVLASEHFGGGGHANAAGGASDLSMKETLTKVKELLVKYFGKN